MEDRTEDLSPKRGLSDNSEKLFRRSKRGASICKSFPGGSDGKESAYNTGDPGSIPGLGRSAGEVIGYPLQYSWGSNGQCRRPGWIPGLGRSSGEGKGYPLQYSGLENSMDCIVHGVTKSGTPLSDFHLLTSL